MALWKPMSRPASAGLPLRTLEQEARLRSAPSKTRSRLVSSSVLYMSMSLDGYIACPNDEPGNPGGDDFMRLHEWYFADGESGLRTAEQADHYKGDHHGVPIFVLSRRPPPPSAANYPSVTYVTGGIASAMAQAKAAAGDRDVLVHGADMVQRALEAGVLDEIQRSIRSRCCSAPAGAVRHLAVADRTGDHPGDRHAAGHPHPLPRPPLNRPASPCRGKDNAMRTLHFGLRVADLNRGHLSSTPGSAMRRSGTCQEPSPAA